MPPAGRGTRGKLKFQPRSSVRRSKEERDAAEKKEQAALKAEDAAIEKERQRAEQRAARGRGRGGARGGRGGLARGGVSGWMNTRGDVGFLSGAMGESSSSRGPALPSAGAGTASGEYNNSRASGTGGGDSRSGGGGTGADGRSSAPVRSDGSMPVRTRELPRRRDGTVMKMINIEHINLISDDEDEEFHGDGATDADRRAKRQYRSPRRGLPPVRAVREPHVPRQMRVNIDLDSLSDEDKSKVRQVAAELPRAIHEEKSTTVDAPDMDVPVKIEPDADVPQPKIEQTQPEPEVEVEVSSTRRSTRSKGKQRIDPKIEQSSISQPAPEPEPMQEPELQQAVEPTKPSAWRRALSELQTAKAAARPDFVRPDCNFISAARPPGWDSKDDIDNWERNVKKAYAIYEELSFPEKMKLAADTSGNDAAANTRKTANQDVEMPDAGATTDTKADIQEAASDRKQDLVYLFQLPPGVPSIEGLRTKEDIEKARLASQDSDVMEVVEPPASPKTSRAKSPESSRKRKATAPASASQPKIKKEDEKEPRVKIEGEEGTAAAAAASGPIPADELPNEEEVRSGKRAPGRERPGYIGDLVVYNTGEVTMDWGGLPLQLKIGQQTNMLQQVLLTSAPVTKAAAVAAEEREEKEAKRGIKKEKEQQQQQQQQTGADASSAMDVDQPAAGGEGATGVSTSAAVAAARGKTDADKAFALGSLAGIFTAVPDFRKLFGAKWS